MDWSAALIAALPAQTASVVKERVLAKDEPLFRRGEAPSAMYCVLSGEVRLIRTLASGVEIVLQRAMQGFVAEASLDQPSYHCDATAALPTRVLSIPRNVFRQALETPTFREFWIQALTTELRRVRSQNERLSLKTTRERILHFAETEGRDGTLILNQSRKAWAAQLGVSHEALYRTLRDMALSGDLLLEKDTIRINGAGLR